MQRTDARHAPRQHDIRIGMVFQASEICDRERSLSSRVQTRAIAWTRLGCRACRRAPLRSESSAGTIGIRSSKARIAFSFSSRLSFSPSKGRRKGATKTPSPKARLAHRRRTRRSCPRFATSKRSAFSTTPITERSGEKASRRKRSAALRGSKPSPFANTSRRLRRVISGAILG